MHIYRCFFLNEGGHIKAAEIMEADALGEVIDKACAMLRERPQHRTVEIWEGAQRVYRAEPDRLKNAELSRAVQQTTGFLRMAAIEARRIADDVPEVAKRLQFFADQLEAEANDLSRLAQADG